MSGEHLDVGHRDWWRIIGKTSASLVIVISLLTMTAMLRNDLRPSPQFTGRAVAPAGHTSFTPPRVPTTPVPSPLFRIPGCP